MNFSSWPAMAPVRHLWMSDGTDAGTKMVDASAPSVDANSRMAAANGRLFFEASSATAGRELYAVDLLQLLGLKWYKNAEQPLQDLGSVSSRFSLPAGVPITSLSVSVDSGHTWIGDLTITLQHVDSGKSVILLNRPGYNGVSGAGCSGKLLNITLVDSAMDRDRRASCTRTRCRASRREREANRTAACVQWRQYGWRMGTHHPGLGSRRFRHAPRMGLDLQRHDLRKRI